MPGTDSERQTLSTAVGRGKAASTGGTPATIGSDPLDHRHDRGRVTVQVTGEIDIANSAELRSRLEVATQNASIIEVDVHAATFFDATGLAALVSGRQSASQQGGRLVLTRVPPYLRRLVIIAGLDLLLLSRQV